MVRASRSVAGSLAVLGGTLAWIACGGAYGGDDPVSEADAGGGAVVDGGNEPAVVDAADDRVAGDGGSAIDGAACDPQDCDCDKDGFVDGTKASCGQQNPDAPRDCDDLDPRRRPDQQQFVADVPLGHDGDWNCDKKVEKVYRANFDCGGNDAGGPCLERGFEGDPACGIEAEYIGCVAGFAGGCFTGLTEKRKQACR